MKKCDIIIPIYNAYDCLKPCIDSVLECTDMKNNRLILIDDKSPDERVLPLLQEYENNKNIILLKNSKNLGFVGTVNRGMKYSKDNDVLLLNSDTEVTPRWLEKIQTCAYSNPMVATVTPLSNNATLASVPVPFERNEIPEGLTLHEMGQIVEECSLHAYPELCTGHGFCLFIKRSVLDEVGFFDAVAFKKGYGEENDFCFRCFDKGYRHLLADDTYIYHKESQSFTTKKLALMANGERVLTERYPFYKSKLNSWIYMRPTDYIGANIAAYLGKKYNTKNILMLVHDFRNYKTNNGGTTLHVYDIVKKLRNKYNFHILSYENGLYKLTSFYKNSESVINIGNQLNCNRYYFYNNAYEEMINKIIDDYGIDMIHIHHMMYHYFNIVDVIEKRKIPTVMSIHDFYCACPLINKLYTYQTYCGNPSISKCGECLKKACGVNYNFINEWREC